jgi:hypothetical protein
VVLLAVCGAAVIHRPLSIGAFEFVVLASLRASQLTRGCLPRIDGDHTVAMTAQLEIACGMVVASHTAPPADVLSIESHADLSDVVVAGMGSSTSRL